MAEVDKEKETPTREEIDKDRTEKVVKILDSHNSVFEKEYDIKDMELKFKVRLHAPNSIDNIKAQAQVQEWGNMLAMTLPSAVYNAYYFLALCVVENERYDDVIIPDFFKDPEKLYNLDIPYMVYQDFDEWRGQFQR